MKHHVVARKGYWYCISCRRRLTAAQLAGNCEDTVRSASQLAGRTASCRCCGQPFVPQLGEDECASCTAKLAN